jgi:hypothetical protein
VVGGRTESFADRRIDVYLGPRELGAADDLEQAIIELPVTL